MNELEIDISDKSRRFGFDTLSHLIEDNFVNHNLHSEIADNITKIKIIREKGYFTLLFEIKSMRIDLSNADDLEKIEEIFEGKEDEVPSFLDRDGVLMVDQFLLLTEDQLKEEIKKYTNKKYKTLGGLRFDFIKFLNKENQLPTRFKKEVEKMYTDEKKLKEILQQENLTEQELLDTYMEEITPPSLVKPTSPVKTRPASPVKTRLTKTEPNAELGAAIFGEHGKNPQGYLDKDLNLNNIEDLLKQGAVISDYLMSEIGYNIINYNSNKMPSASVIINLIKLLIKYGGNVNAHDARLFFAAASNERVFPELAKYILDHGFDIKTYGPVALVIRFDDENMTNLLLEKGVDINKAIEVAKKRDPSIVRDLEKLRNEMISPTKTKPSLVKSKSSSTKISAKARQKLNEEFLEAITDQNTKKVQQLLNEGVNVNDNNGEALSEAIRNTNFEIIKLIVENNAKLKQDDFISLLADDYFEAVKLFLDKGFQMENDGSELFYASDDKTRNLLIDHGADINKAFKFAEKEHDREKFQRLKIFESKTKRLNKK